MNWVEEEFETIDLGDKRLNRRVIDVVEGLGLAPGRTIPQAFKTWGEIKACYNFFNNDLVSEEKILNPHTERTIERIKEERVVLLISDSTDLNFTTKLAMAGKERLLSKQNGLWLHPTLAITPERLNLGIIDANFWHRNPEVLVHIEGSSTARDKAPIEEKESYRWLKSYLKACEVAREVPETEIINISDREADIIEIFEAAHEQEEQSSFARFIIRSQHNRLLDESDEDIKITRKLWHRLKKSESIGEIEFTIPATEKRKGRKVQQQLKAVTVKLKCGNNYKRSRKVKINAVMAIEENPPKGEDALIWIFITNMPINNFNDVHNIIKYYLCRWEIELFFRILKGGCKIEDRRLHSTDKMKNLTSILMILAWRVQFTMMLGRVHPEMSTGDIFEEAEWKAVYKVSNGKKSLPRKPPELGDFIKMIAVLGGYVNQKNTPPGVQTIWKGMARMIDFAIAWEAFGG